VNYRPWLEEQVLRQMVTLPSDAFEALAQTLARICADPGAIRKMCGDPAYLRVVVASNPKSRTGLSST
jgi:hypothetical protein